MAAITLLSIPNPISLSEPFSKTPFSIPKSPFYPFPSKKPSSSHLHVTAPANQDLILTSSDEESAAALRENESRGGDDDSKFTWRDHWYPVTLVEDLDPSLPTPFQLLGRDIVLWFDKGSSQWVAFDDKCPHRLAPLSEGED